MKNIFIFFGAPGSGKGTQAEMLAKELKLPKISSGDLLRQEIKDETKIGKKVEKTLSSGGLVPNNIIEELLFKRVSKRNASKGFILDGYPRSKGQQDNLLKKLEDITNEKDNIFVVLIDVNNREVKSRLGGRRMCDCGATYHLKYNPPKKRGVCDLCASKLYVREDDKSNVIADRLKLYHKEIKPILKHWAGDEKLIIINGEQGIKKIHADINRKLKKYRI